MKFGNFALPASVSRGIRNAVAPSQIVGAFAETASGCWTMPLKMLSGFPVTQALIAVAMVHSFKMRNTLQHWIPSRMARQAFRTALTFQPSSPIRFTIFNGAWESLRQTANAYCPLLPTEGTPSPLKALTRRMNTEWWIKLLTFQKTTCTGIQYSKEQVLTAVTTVDFVVSCVRAIPCKTMETDRNAKISKKENLPSGVTSTGLLI